MFRAYPWTSLRTPLLLLVLLFVVPLVSFLASDLARERSERQDAAERQALEVAQSFAEDQEDLFVSTERMLRALSQLPEVRDQSDPLLCDALMRKMRDAYEVYNNLLVADAAGNVWCFSEGLEGPLNVWDRPYFRGAMSNREFAPSPYLLGRAAGNPLMIVGYPVFDPGGAPRGVIAASFSLDWFSDTLATLELPAGSTVMLVDQNGTVLARHPDDVSWMGRALPADFLATVRPSGNGPRAVRAEGLEGEDQLLVSVPLSDLLPGVFLSVSVPAGISFDGVNQRFMRELAALLVLSLLLLVALVVGANRFILTRLDALVRASQRLASGDLETRSGLPHTRDEVGRLTASFDSMAVSLEANQEALRQSEERYEALISALHEGVIMHAADGTITALNQSAEEILGLTREQMAQQAPPPTGWSIAHEDGMPITPETHPAPVALRTGEAQSNILVQVQKADGLHWVSVNTRPLFRSGTSAPYAVVSSFADITRRKGAEEALTHQATHDALTGLPNRTLFQDRLRQALARADRSGEVFGIVFMDMDGFKGVNDTLGHAAGDKLLRQVAARLTDCVREGDTVARLGGDEFTAILRDVGAAEGAAKVAERMLDAFQQPFRIADESLSMTMSFGIALAPTDGRDPDVLLQAADEAVYHAKVAGKNTFRFSSVLHASEGDAGSSGRT